MGRILGGGIAGRGGLGSPKGGHRQTQGLDLRGVFAG
jgi:hypothetical protein